MMSRRIRFIIVIVACSLVGIFLFQGYWLYNSYQLATQQFEKDVTEVVKRLERNHAVADMETMGFFTDSLGNTNEERLTRTLDFLLSTPNMQPKEPFADLSKERKIIAESKVMFTYMDDTTNLGGKVNLDSIVRIREHLSDSVKLIRTDMGGQLFTINTPYDYGGEEFAGFSESLTHELDSLLRSVGVGSSFAFKLSNFSERGAEYISDSTLFDRQSHQINSSAKIGLLKPYRLTLSMSNDIVYILRNMLWVLLASVVIMGITVWAFTYMLRTILQQKRLSDIKNDFINNMTHEFKTPIATVSLAVEAMKSFDVMNKPEQTREYLDICQHELNRISVMVEKVLKMAAFEQLDIKLSLQKTDIGKLLNNVVDNMRPQLEKKAAKLSIRPIGDPVEAVVDRDHFANVVYNLIDNSLKYNDKTSEIEVRYGITDDGSVQLAVSDNGIGIPAAYRERVFENFFRVPTGNIHNAKGFGLGLSYVASIVKKHQGNIDVKSVVGAGSTFTITLPVNQLMKNN